MRAAFFILWINKMVLGGPKGSLRAVMNIMVYFSSTLTVLILLNKYLLIMINVSEYNYAEPVTVLILLNKYLLIIIASQYKYAIDRNQRVLFCTCYITTY